MNKDQIDKFKENEKRSRKDRFEQFLNNSLTRFAISTVPGGEHQEVLRTLLRAAFDTGFTPGNPTWRWRLRR